MEDLLSALFVHATIVDRFQALGRGLDSGGSCAFSVYFVVQVLVGVLCGDALDHEVYCDYFSRLYVRVCCECHSCGD